MGHARLTAKIGGVFVPLAVAGLVYWALAWSAKVPAASDLTQLLQRKLKR
jgi:hypothetical protein